MSNEFNELKILKYNNNNYNNNINFINRQLTIKPKSRGILKSPSKEKNIKNTKKVKIKNERQSLPNFIPKVDKSISSSLIDRSFPTIKKQSSLGRPNYFRNNSALNFAKNEVKPLVYYIPKNIEYKLMFDMIFDHYYILSKNSGDLKKIENFVLEMQKRFNKKCENIFTKEEINDNNSPFIKTQPTKTSNYNSNNSNNTNSNNTNIYYEIEDKINYFHKLENLMALYSLILFYLVKNNKYEKAKIIYLIMIKQNIDYINYLEQLIDYKILLKDRNNKSIIKTFRISVIILLKIYSTLIKFSFLLHLSYYGYLFMKKYFNLSHQIYLHLINYHKMKNSVLDNDNKINYWLCNLNHYAAYYSIANYLPMNIPISLCNIILQIYNSIDNKYYDSNDKKLLLCNYYNKSLLLYVNGKSQEAINCLKEGKKKIFMYIEEYFPDDDNGGIITKKNSTYGSLFIDDSSKKKTKEKDKNKESNYFKRLFRNFNQNRTFFSF